MNRNLYTLGEASLLNIDVPEETMKAIEDYFSKKPGTYYTDDISEELGIELEEAK